jgi:hypothetical protein
MTGNSEMLYRELGSTGERVSAIGLGGWHLSLKHVDEQLADRPYRNRSRGHLHGQLLNVGILGMKSMAID